LIERCICRIDEQPLINSDPREAYDAADYGGASDQMIRIENQKLEELSKKHRRYQVITKACNYVLKPGEVYQGNWHVEGCLQLLAIMTDL